MEKCNGQCIPEYLVIKSICSSVNILEVNVAELILYNFIVAAI